MNAVDLLAGKIAERREVLFIWKPARLETPHLACRRRGSGGRLPAHDPAHRRITAQPLGVVYVLDPVNRPNTACRNILTSPIPTSACRPSFPVRASAGLWPAIAARPSASSSSR